MQFAGKNMRFATLLAALLVVAGSALGCGDATEDGNNGNNGEPDYTSFTPFAEENLANQRARLSAHSDIVDLRKSATLEDNGDVYADIEAKYQANSLQEKVQGRTDDHLETKGYGVENVGTFLDDQIAMGIEMGKNAQTQAELDWAGQIVDKTMLVFFYHSVYHELYKRYRKNFDEAFGYYGLNFDGTVFGGIAGKAEGRDTEFGTAPINEPLFRAFVDAQVAMAGATSGSDDQIPEDNEAYQMAWEEIDRQMLRAMGYYAIHEVDGLTEDNADIKLIEARIVWDAAAAWAAEEDEVLAGEIMDLMYPGGVPERSSDEYFTQGLQDVRDGNTEVEKQQLRNKMLEMVQNLEN